MRQVQVKHRAFYGKSMQGKTWAMKRIAQELLNMKQRVFVWSDADLHSWPKGCILTDDEDMVEAWLRDPKYWQQGNAYLFLDEAASLFEETSRKTHPNLWRVTRKGRHRGFTVHIATQRPTIIPARVRDQCDEVFCFKLSDPAMAKYIWQCYGAPSIDGRPIYDIIPALEQLQCIFISGGEAQIINL